VDACVAVAYYLFVALPFVRWSDALAIDLLAASVFAFAVVFRRLSPGLALALAWAGAILQMLGGGSPNLADLAIFAVLYATAAYGSRIVFWLGFASSFAGAIVITLYVVLGPLFASASLSWRSIPTALAVLLAAGFALLLSWTSGALVRTAVRARENRRAQQRAEAEAAVEQERVRIARDMHDVVAHSLAVVVAQADGARYAAAADPEAATRALATISTTARAALADVRLLLGQLRHSEGNGPQPALADLEALYAQVRASGVDLRVTVDPAPAVEPPAGAQLAVYRILQEALTNALRHGSGAVAVRLAWRSDRVELEVGNPVPEPAPPVVPGHGVIGMRERAQLAGGTLTATAEHGSFVVRGILPLGSAA
jgi:signal transduction histidine kinase